MKELKEASYAADVLISQALEIKAQRDDLLAALEGVIDYAGDFTPVTPRGKELHRAAMDLALATIKKAKGQS